MVGEQRGKRAASNAAWESAQVAMDIFASLQPHHHATAPFQWAIRPLAARLLFPGTEVPSIVGDVRGIRSSSSSFFFAAASSFSSCVCCSPSECHGGVFPSLLRHFFPSPFFSVAAAACHFAAGE